MSSVARLSGGILTLAAVAAVACAGDQTPSKTSTPVGPTPSRSDLVLMCHLEEPGTAYGPLLVPESAVAGHLAHGDGPVGDLVSGQGEVKFGSDCAFAPLLAVEIGFGALRTNGVPFSVLQESGFTIVARSGPWVAMSMYGAPAPAVIFTRDANGPDLEAELAVSRGGQLFMFSDVALYSNLTTIPYSIKGYRGIREVISMSAVIPNTFGNFRKVTNTSAPVMLDSLVFRIVNPKSGSCCENQSGLDNIKIKH